MSQSEQEHKFALCHELQKKLSDAGAACPDCGVTRHLHGYKTPTGEMRDGELLWQCWKCAWVGQESRHAGFDGAPETATTTVIGEKDLIYPKKENV